MFKKADNTNEIISAMESNLQSEYIRSTIDGNKIKVDALEHLSKASLLFKELGRAKESAIVNKIIKSAKDGDYNSPEMHDLFVWMGYDSDDLNFIEDIEISEDEQTE